MPFRVTVWSSTHLVEDLATTWQAVLLYAPALPCLVFQVQLSVSATIDLASRIDCHERAAAINHYGFNHLSLEKDSDQ